MFKKRIYLDHAAATPVDKKVAKAMKPFSTEKFANPASIHAEGVAARRAVEESRVGVARLLNVRPEEVVFTGGGTEADNLALFGVVEAAKRNGIAVPHIVTINIEHPAITEACRKLEKWGTKVSYVPVEADGRVDPKKIAMALTPETVLVTVQLANSEIGTIQPLRDIARAIAEFKVKQNKKDDHTLGILNYPYFHTDAGQGPNYLDVNFQKYGVDLMTLDAAKIYGPKGIGLLAVKRQVKLAPQLVGGSQEHGLRAGTENVAGVVGLAAALKIADSMREKEVARLKELQKFFISSLQKLFSNGEIAINPSCNERLPNNVSICVGAGTADAEFLVLRLDAGGVAASSGSACTNLQTAAYSYVIEALEKAQEASTPLGASRSSCKSSSVRFSFGRHTSKRELELTLRILRSIIKSPSRL
jgi:cysteine desulfurase